MDTQCAQNLVNNLWDEDKARWRNQTHIATNCFRKGVVGKLSRDPQLSGDWACSVVEIFLTEILPDIDCFQGIFAVDEIGFWYYDGDGHIDEHIWRQRVIPWRYVKGLILYQTS